MVDSLYFILQIRYQGMQPLHWILYFIRFFLRQCVFILLYWISFFIQHFISFYIFITFIQYRESLLLSLCSMAPSLICFCTNSSISFLFSLLDGIINALPGIFTFFQFLCHKYGLLIAASATFISTINTAKVCSKSEAKRS